ncbi:hypothetical protein GWK08_17415 [Leptobacterium flavescens]|uniref:C1q domain-containing protein n=1 Tax=Leptobacterium flavescens TaxID=472055 RepID=A0A6P0UTS3_9FLAO|nr:hypothetical protein [Leptobacterium flavescens]NER15239.1 hypothetical protein [Leptobacterium flavescens]
MTLKKGLLILVFAIPFNLCSQVGIGTSTPDPSSILDINSTDKGLLIPRMSESQRNSITSPVAGLMIYQIDNSPGFYYYNGSGWFSVASSSGDNLGNHTATQTFDLSGQQITNASSMELMGTSTTVFGFNRFDAGDTANDQFRLTANGTTVFGILGDGRVNTRGNILMVNNATVDNIDLSEMIGITGANLGTFSGSTLADGLSVKEALQVLENAVEAVLPSQINDESKTIGKKSQTAAEAEINTPKFSVYREVDLKPEATRSDVVVNFDKVEFDTAGAYISSNNSYKIPFSGTYFIQFQCRMDYSELEGIEEVKNTAYLKLFSNGREISKSPILFTLSGGDAAINLFRSFEEGDLIQAVINIGSRNILITGGPMRNHTTSFSGFMVK